MNARERTRASRFLSRVLRHDPASVGITLDPGGWVDICVLLDALARHGLDLDRGQLADVVGGADKKLFTMQDGRIRADHGHSLPVELGLPPSEPPAVLYHGTAAGSVTTILEQGLQRRGRQYVHLHERADVATRVGRRHGSPVLLLVDAAGLAADGRPMYRSGSGVWLVESVPPSYLRRG